MLFSKKRFLGLVLSIIALDKFLIIKGEWQTFAYFFLRGALWHDLESYSRIIKSHQQPYYNYLPNFKGRFLWLLPKNIITKVFVVTQMYYFRLNFLKRRLRNLTTILRKSDSPVSITQKSWKPWTITETIHEKRTCWKGFIKLYFGNHKDIYIILNLVRQ